MNDFRGEILAGAAFARQQHRRRRADADLLEQRAHRFDRLALADNAGQAEGLRIARPQDTHFAAQLRRLERLFDEQHHLVEIERLVGVVERAALHRLDGGADLGVGGQHDHQRVGIRLLDLLQHRQAVRVGQREIEQHEVDAVAVLRHGFTRRAGFDGPIAFFLETVDQRPANQRLIVDDEDGGVRHQAAGALRADDEPLQLVELEWFVEDVGA